jgi:hypothetical protein
MDLIASRPTVNQTSVFAQLRQDLAFDPALYERVTRWAQQNWTTLVGGAGVVSTGTCAALIWKRFAKAHANDMAVRQAQQKGCKNPETVRRELEQQFQEQRAKLARKHNIDLSSSGDSGGSKTNLLDPAAYSQGYSMHHGNFASGLIFPRGIFLSSQNMSPDRISNIRAYGTDMAKLLNSLAAQLQQEIDKCEGDPVAQKKLKTMQEHLGRVEEQWKTRGPTVNGKPTRYPGAQNLGGNGREWGQEPPSSDTRSQLITEAVSALRSGNIGAVVSQWAKEGEPQLRALFTSQGVEQMLKYGIAGSVVRALFDSGRANMVQGYGTSATLSRLRNNPQASPALRSQANQLLKSISEQQRAANSSQAMLNRIQRALSSNSPAALHRLTPLLSQLPQQLAGHSLNANQREQLDTLTNSALRDIENGSVAAAATALTALGAFLSALSPGVGSLSY